MSKHGQYTPNEMRSNVKNPNNPAHEADHRNREAQAANAEAGKATTSEAGGKK